MNYVVVWKDTPGQQVSTVVDANNEPVQRDPDYLVTNGIPIVEDALEVFATLARADGQKIAVTHNMARSTLGWDV